MTVPEPTAGPEHQDPRDRRLGAGVMIGTRYRLEQIAGTGGMATVWRARDEQLARTVAIKVMSDTLAASPEAVARFAREARTHAKIQHPNLVQVFDYSITATQPYLVMEYIAGATLSERLDRGGFSPAAIQTLARELLSAVACVHDHGVLHRDIKPANVLLDAGDRARLTDFGLARLEESSHITQPGEIVGTLRFLAPELLDGQPSTRQSDLYALGVLLRTAAADTTALPEVEDLIAWLTRPNPHERPRDAHTALGAVGPTAIQPRPSSPPSRDRPKRRRVRTPRPRGKQLRNRLIAIAALAVATTGTALAVVESGRGSAHAVTPSAKTAGASPRTTGSPTTDASFSRTPAGPTTIDQQLRALASSVRRAAAP